MEMVKIPEKRKRALLSCKKIIEKKAKVSLEISDSVFIDGEPIQEMTAADVVKAIGRGFDPESAFLLFDEEFSLEVINLPDIIGPNRNRLEIVKGRIIGRYGSSRKKIEELAHVAVTVYGKTVSIIGKWENVNKAKESIMLLASGSKHGTAYRVLNHDRKRQKGKHGRRDGQEPEIHKHS